MEVAKSSVNQELFSGNKGKATKEKIQNTLTDEIIIGICAPIGSLTKPVIESLSDILVNKYNYDEVKVIKLSEYIKEHITNQPKEELKKTQAFTELMNKIRGGDELRKKYRPACLAELAINEIHLGRYKNDDLVPTEELKSRRKCFIINSIKNKEELDVLRSVYNDLFYSFSIFSPIHERANNLLNKGLSKEEIEEIIKTDEYENNDSGQNVRETFIEGDFIVRVSEKNQDTLKDRIQRYLHLIFESAVITPKPEEIAMYQAKSAAGNSACLSRQVGATITNEKGEIISRGWNDVPKFGGNLYKEGDMPDHRCKNIGCCSNDKTKNTIAEHIVELIQNDSELNGIFNIKNADKVRAIEKIRTIIRRNSKVKDLIEFSRSVHAEMHAIIIGSQLSSNKMIGGKLFCTTYPCHNCARHIVVAGIKEVYFIEPYVKSLCLDLHSDSLTEDENSTDKVKILIYDGVAPRRFLDFFTMSGARKDKNGDVLKQNLTNIAPKNRISLQAIPTLEQQAIHSLHEAGLLIK